MSNDHGFSKASPNGNYMLDTNAPKPIIELKQCEVCGNRVDTLYPAGYIESGAVVYICQDCKDYEELMANQESERFDQE
jgi:hypothetical protein